MLMAHCHQGSSDTRAFAHLYDNDIVRSKMGACSNACFGDLKAQQTAFISIGQPLTQCPGLKVAGPGGSGFVGNRTAISVFATWKSANRLIAGPVEIGKKRESQHFFSSPILRMFFPILQQSCISLWESVWDCRFPWVRLTHAHSSQSLHVAGWEAKQFLVRRFCSKASLLVLKLCLSA